MCVAHWQKYLSSFNPAQWRWAIGFQHNLTARVKPSRVPEYLLWLLAHIKAGTDYLPFLALICAT